MLYLHSPSRKMIYRHWFLLLLIENNIIAKIWQLAISIYSISLPTV